MAAAVARDSESRLGLALAWGIVVVVAAAVAALAPGRPAPALPGMGPAAAAPAPASPRMPSPAAVCEYLPSTDTAKEVVEPGRVLLPTPADAWGGPTRGPAAPPEVPSLAEDGGAGANRPASAPSSVLPEPAPEGFLHGLAPPAA
jgi:hypothetical protein